MRRLNTLRGIISAEDVNLICPHEHLFIDMTHEAVEPKTEAEKKLFYSDICMNNLCALRRNPYISYTNLILDDVDLAVEETKCLADVGCNLLVDVTTVGVGRDMMKLKAFSEKSDLNVIVGTGLFVHDALPKMYEHRSAEQIAAWMIDEIENGHCDTGIKPGVIGEIGISEKIYPVEEKSIRAAAIASVVTDLPIYLHTYPWNRVALNAVKMLLEDGVKTENICICHLDVAFDDEYLRQALDLGIYLEFDNLSKEFFFEPQEGAFAGGPFETDVARVHKLKELIAEGYANQLLLANDLCLKGSLHKYGGPGYDHAFRNFVPMMRLYGIFEEDIHKLLYVNPKRFLFQV